MMLRRSWMTVIVPLALAAQADAQQHRDPQSAGENALAAAADPWAQLEPTVSADELKPIRRAGRTGRAASGGITSDGSSQPSWLRSALSLAGVVGLIVLLAWGYRAIASSGGFALAGRVKRPGLIEVLSRTSLSPRQSLCLVRVGPRIVLVGLTADRISALDVIDDADLTAQLAGEARARTSDGNAAEFAACLKGQAADYEEDAKDLDETRAPNELKLATVRSQLSGTLARIRKAVGNGR